MKYLLLLPVLFYSATVIAQKDTSFPLSLSIRVERAYDVMLPKSYFSDPQSLSLYNIKTDSVKQHKYDIAITLGNTAQRPIFVWLMNCSWEDNFRVNNNYMYLRGQECDHNFPERVKIMPGESKTYTAHLSKSIKFDNPCKNCIYGPQVETTKMGLVLIDDLFQPRLDGFFGYDLAMEDRSRWKMVWSNPLYLLTKEEANPAPKEIPVYRNGQ